MERGYVKLYRSIDQNELLENDNTALIVFIKLLTRVNRLNGKYTTGRKKLASACNLNPSTLYSALKRLEASTIIQQQSNKTSTTISICNWWEYQQDVNKTSNKLQSTVNTKQEKKKKDNNIKKERDILAILNKVTGRNFSVEPVGVEKTKAKFSDNDIERALRNMYQDEWHKSKMGTLKSDYLLRATTIDQFKDFKRPDSNYVLPGAAIKRDLKPNEPSLTRAQMLKKEYEDG